MADLTLSPQVFAILSALVSERVGLSYSLHDKPLFDAKSSARALEAGYESMLDYYYFLRYDDPGQVEFQALVEALTVHETYFFRELSALQMAISQLLVPSIERHGKARVWCSACATGEEAYTLAMLLDQAGVADKVEVLASDLSDSALRRAQSGVFSPRALRQQRDHVLAARYLEQQQDAIRAAPDLRKRIEFRRVNLVDAQAVAALGQFDLIACRNVLIYFNDATAKRVVDLLTERLTPEGSLLVGVSESLMRFGTDLTCEERAGAFYYRKAPQ